MNSVYEEKRLFYSLKGIFQGFGTTDLRYE